MSPAAQPLPEALWYRPTIPCKLDRCQSPVQPGQLLEQHWYIQIQLPSAPGYLAADSWGHAAGDLHLLEIDANPVGFIRRGKWIDHHPNLHESSGAPKGLAT